MIWTFEERLPDGHRLFSANTSDGVKYAIADDSGSDPERTDDGVLWLDVSRCLVIEKDDSFEPPRQCVFIPLVNDKGERYRATTDVSTLLHLGNKYKWQVEDVDVKAIYEIA